MMFSVIIATRNRASMLGRALDSLGAQRGAPRFELLVIDNGSSDRTPEVVADHAHVASEGVLRIFVPEPNRAAARNVGIVRARGEIVLFIDDDVDLPPGFLAAHARAHAGSATKLAVSGPIINVPSYEEKPEPRTKHYSRAFFCTCNVSVAREVLLAVDGFDEGFDRYGWEDTELGIRLRRAGVRRHFTWKAHLYHIKPPADESLEYLARKSMEKGRMAARLVAKDPSVRTRLATGAYFLNELRAQAFVPHWSLPWYFGLASNERVPAMIRDFARGRALDGLYIDELRRARAARK
ncbi:MAG TPA: glycosyltransferase family A protein [Candidatus Baltobacteraceae bacterium]|jgi:glycosyltransferase involved in cell wall biosynthesis|nr:glycosyltransferase family A protein [Candidatus Baltobacteraceae bacterium]